MTTIASRTARGVMLLPLRGVMGILNRSERKVLADLDEGKPRYVFNVAMDAKGKKRELRFLPDSVADLAIERECALTMDDVFAMLIPHDEPEVTTPEVMHCLNIHETHALHLLIRHCRGTGNFRPGPGGSCRATRESLCRFLESRRLA